MAATATLSSPAATTSVAVLLLLLALGAAGQAADEREQQLATQFADQIQPLLKQYCFECHGQQQQEAKLNLSDFATAAAVAGNLRLWEHVRQRLETGDMPPEEAERKPTATERRSMIAWIEALYDFEAQRNSGDPGTVLARRLSNAEFDYTIRDLTGVDLRPTHEFPVDPANEAGFDNSGESLAMSPALLKKYLAAARQVADHLVLKPDGFVFAPFPVVADTDRDKYCVQRIVDFYHRHEVDYAAYFLAAWQYQHRAALERPDAELSDFARQENLSPKYLATVWALLNEPTAVGPEAALQALWRGLPAPQRGQALAPPRAACERLRDVVLRMRKRLVSEPRPLKVDGISPGSQPIVLWNNRAAAEQHQHYTGDPASGAQRLQAMATEAEPKLATYFMLDAKDESAAARFGAALARFCRTFPATFVVSDRGPYFDPSQAGQGRLLTAGFHLMQGYFRDDQPLYALVLSEAEQNELDALWRELNFITRVPERQYKDFIFFERAEPPRFMREAEFDFARSEDKDAIAPEKMQRLAKAHLDKVRRLGGGDEAMAAIEDYYTRMAADIRWVAEAHQAAEPIHLAALLAFAERAYRRPLTPQERDEMVAFYRALRERDHLSHEDALRDSIASVLLSPHFCYRVDLAPSGTAAAPLSDHALASRLSYFLWSSMPDAELLGHAAAGDLHEPAVLVEQTRRLLRDERVRGLAVEFGGNWLDFRRFAEHNSVDRERFPAFTNELRQAMYEEPVRFLQDSLQQNGSVMEFLFADHTFVNSVLARHYGMELPAATPETWVRADDARRYGRGGLLGMAVFQTKSSPGLRTSPVKRGYWVVRRLLGEHIPPPPPAVPELPKDEAQPGELSLPQLLARHRDNKSCAGCHQRFDSVGLAFEGYGPIGERRSVDLGGRPVEATATFPGGRSATGLDGLRGYLREERQAEYLDNLCRQLLAYGLGRSLLPSDQATLQAMQERLVKDDYSLHGLVETIVLSPQFLRKRGLHDPRNEQ